MGKVSRTSPVSRTPSGLIVFDGSNPDRVMFSGNSLPTKKLCLQYYRDNEHNNVITNRMGAMATKYICNGSDALYDKTHKFDEVCSLCTTPPCTKDEIKYCGTCNRRFLSEKCFQNHLTLTESKLVCQWRQVCRNCSYSVKGYSKHECLRNFLLLVIRSNLQATFTMWLH